MKRNLDLLRGILDYIEDTCSGENVSTVPIGFLVKIFPSITQNMLNEHIKLLVERGLVEGNPAQFEWFVTGLTWEGHDFLFNAKNETIWQRTKQIAGLLSFDAFANALKEVAISYVKQFTAFN